MMLPAPGLTFLELRSVLIQEPLVVSPERIVVEAIALMVGEGRRGSTAPSCVLVQREGQVLGILTERDVVRLSAQQQPLAHLSIGQVMTTPVITLRESACGDLYVALQLFQQHHIRHLPIVDEQDRLVGLLTEERLRQALNPLEFHQLAAVLPVGIFRADTAGNGTYVNAHWCQIVGLDPEAAVRAGWQQGMHPDDCERTVAEWEQLLQTHRPFQLEYALQRPDGTMRWVLGQAATERDAKGQILGYVATLTDISDRKRSEEALQTSEAHQRALISAIPDLIVRSNRAGIYLEFLATPTFSVLGDLTQLIGTHVSETLSPELAHQRMVMTQRALQTNSIQVYEQDLSFEGRTQVEEVRIVPYGEDEVLMLVRDISDRKAAEQALSVSEAKSRAILEAIPDLMVRVGADGRYRKLVSPHRAFAIPPQEMNIEGLRLAEVLPADLAHRHFLHLQKALQTGELQIFEQRVQVGDHLQYEEVRIIKSGEDEALFMIRDISDRKQAELQLQNLIAGTAATVGEDFFPALVRHIAEALNVSYAMVTEKKKDTLQVLALWANGTLSPTFSFPVAQTPCEQAMREGQFYCESLVQEQFPADLNLAKMAAQSYLGLALRNNQGKAIGNLCILDQRPIQGLQRAENLLRVFAARAATELERQRATQALEKLNQALEQRVIARTAELQTTNAELLRATRLKDEFLANMSHELRTPLNAILGMTEGLREEIFGPINEQQRKALTTVERSGSHLLELINDILDVAKIEAGQTHLDCAATSISALCQSSLAFVKQQAFQKRIQLDVQFQPHLPALVVDERRIRQVLINLLNNAVKFTPEGGSITLTATRLSPEQTQTDILSQDILRITVVDTGIGIAPENIQKLFQPFSQIDSTLNRQYNGTGLGLALVKRIVELHGGRVGLTSELNVGSCFIIDLPYLSPSLSSEFNVGRDARDAGHSSISGDNADTLPLPGTGQNFLIPKGEGGQDGVTSAPLILLVEDNEATTSTVSSYLKAKGYDILLAKNGQESLDLAQACPPDLILMDIQMPGMNGLEAIERLRCDPTLGKIPIIALTALAMPGDRERCIEAGAKEYLTKPVRLKELSQLIATLLFA